MGRSVHLANYSREDLLQLSESYVEEGMRLKTTTQELNLEGGWGRIIVRSHGITASLGIRGVVPEIPCIEHIDDTGWVFRQVWNQGSKVPIIAFDIPEGSERFLERLLMFYIMLYGD